VLAGVILASVPTIAASEDVKKSTPTRLSIASAANLEFALDDLIKEFQGKYPATKINVTYGHSGTFFAQLQGGAPYDLFLSADMAYPQKLAEAGLELITFSFTPSAVSLFGC
jgi:molybdate transport system substrate-binding protein